MPQRITVDAEQVRRLVEQQFPQWAGLPVQPVVNGGWDNWTFHLGAGMLVRLPSAAEYALAVDKEHRWLAALAPQLPLPIPVPLAKGEPGTGYPYPWSVYHGSTASPPARTESPIPSDSRLTWPGSSRPCGASTPPTVPAGGKHNWFRGGTLRAYEGEVQIALAALDGHIDVDLAREIWQTALEARWDAVESWFHGDVDEGNLLLDDGQLTAVIDFGTCGVGDPACDLAIVRGAVDVAVAAAHAKVYLADDELEPARRPPVPQVLRLGPRLEHELGRRPEGPPEDDDGLVVRCRDV